MTLEEAQKHLSELVRNLRNAGDLLLVEDGQPLACLVSVERPSLRHIKPSSIGAFLRPFPSAGDDLLGEMLESSK